MILCLLFEFYDINNQRFNLFISKTVRIEKETTKL